MPVVIQVNNHEARPWKRFGRAEKPEGLLSTASPTEWMKMESIMETTFSEAYLGQTDIWPCQNGFFYSAVNAYHGHHNLTIRPEDVWFSILVQLNFFINKNAEGLRKFFVNHDGKQTIRIQHNESWGQDAMEFADEVGQRVKDPELKDWIMPDFSTTTPEDKIVASILMMGAMQAYFEYRSDIVCGIPSVTLQGTRNDWVKLLQRTEYLSQLGAEPTQFQKLLEPILRRFVYSFDYPNYDATRAFWNHIAHEHEPKYCGATNYFTGWITAFAFWKPDGTPVFIPDRASFHLDGVHYPSISIYSVPYGIAGAPVTVVDSGQSYNARMIAGSVAIHKVDETTIRPATGWFMYRLKEDGDMNPSDLGLEDHLAPGDWTIRACECPRPGSMPKEFQDLEVDLTMKTPSVVIETQSFSGTTLAGSIRSSIWRKSMSEKFRRNSWFSRLSGKAVRG